MSWEYQFYRKKLDRILDFYRAKHMGQHKRLADLVPDGNTLPSSLLGERCAQVLIFRMTEISQLNDTELREVWQWLRTAIGFILAHNPDDWTLCSLVKLMESNQETLKIMGKKFGAFSLHEQQDFAAIPAYIREHLEETVWNISKIELNRLNDLEQQLE